MVVYACEKVSASARANLYTLKSVIKMREKRVTDT